MGAAPAAWWCEVDPGVRNVAETVFASSIWIRQAVAFPLQAPPQPPKTAPAAGDSVSVTAEPLACLALHVGCPLPQAIPPPVTEPLPPLTSTSSVPSGCSSMRSAPASMNTGLAISGQLVPTLSPFRGART